MWQETGFGASVNEDPAEELHKPVIKKLKRKKINARFKDNIWTADLAKTVHYLLLIVVLNISYVWEMFFPNMLGLSIWKIKKLKQFFTVLLKQ